MQVSSVSEDIRIDDLIAADESRIVLMKAALDAMPGHIAILNSCGRIVTVNARWIEYAKANNLEQSNFGVGLNYVDICRPAAETSDPDATLVSSTLTRILSQRSNEAFEHAYLCPHPGDPARDRWFLLRLIPFCLVDSFFVLVSHEDVTKFYALERSRTLLETAISQSRSGIMMTDANGKIVYVNAGFTMITGYPAEEVVGANPRLLKSGKISEETYQDLWQTISVGENWKGQVCNRRRNGSLYWEEMTISPVRDPAGVITHYVAVKEDITEARHNARLLLEAQKMEGVGQMAAGLAHDFNNLLNIIYGSAQLADGAPQEDMARHLANISAAALQGVAITKALSTFSRRGDMHPVESDLSEAMQAIEPLLKQILGKKIAVKFDFAKGLPPTLIDVNAFNNSVINLVGNARDAMPHGGELTISLSQTQVRSGHGDDLTNGDYVVLAVSDTGDGMPDEVVRNALDPFFSTKPEGKGTGLGLAMVNSFCCQSGGAVRIDSRVGKGTSVAMYLPSCLVRST